MAKLNAQKLGNYFQYATYGNSYSYSRIQPLDENQYYWILNNDGLSSNQGFTVDSLVLYNFLQNYKKKLNYQNFTTRDAAILLMNKKSPNWAVNFTATSLNSKIGHIEIINTLTSGNDLVFYCQVSGDSIKAYSESGQIASINIPDTAGFAVIKINQKAEITLENFFVTENLGTTTKLLWADEKKYCIYFTTSIPPRFQPKFFKELPSQYLLPDSQTTAILLQYEFGNKKILNSMTGTFPVAFYPFTSNRSFTSNNVLIGGTYASSFGKYFAYNPVYKINTNSSIPIKRPVNFSKKRNYLYWINVNMQNWTLDEVEYMNTSDSINSFILDCGILKNGYWFQCSNLDSIALNNSTLKWQNSKGYGQSIFTFNAKTKTINTAGFPQGILNVYSDGDSLILIGGDNTKVFSDPNVDMDKSPYFHYPINKGHFIAEYTLDGNLVWARNADITTNSAYSTRFISHNGGRYLSISDDLRNSINLGFNNTKLFPLNFYIGASGTVTQLTKAPICDFDIEQITYNHVTINYKGALNANFCYKYGDGSKDSNYNQRNFIHSYKKTGTFLLYCIAKNDFGRDTAYYSVDIYDIVSTTKLNKNNAIKLYPNPTENTLSWDSQTTQHVDIFDTNGRLIERIKTTQNTINIGHIPAGIYLVSVHTKDGSYIQKVMKQ